MSGGKGKRGPSAPLATTSDEDEPVSESPSTPCRQTAPPLQAPAASSPLGLPGLPSPPPTPADSPHTGEHDYAATPADRDHLAPSGDLTEGDGDYENVSSPGNSSTASGPIYVRQPGFTHHAHRVTVAPPTPPPASPSSTVSSAVSRPRIKKKKTTLLAVKDGLKKREPTPPKTRPKREPLPMRLRALPQSFWQQPNVPHTVSPGTAYPILPPLCSKDGEDVVDELRPVTPPEERESKEKAVRPVRLPDRKITVANTDLLFKLFEGIESDKRGNFSTQKRGRPRKVVPCTNKTFVSDEDPYLVDCMSEKLFPQLSLDSSGRSQQSGSSSNNSSSSSSSSSSSAYCGGGSTVLQVVTFHEGDKCINLPALSVEQNYSQMLSELVMHI